LFSSKRSREEEEEEGKKKRRAGEHASTRGKKWVRGFIIW
jgi:hypothetical protein